MIEIKYVSSNNKEYNLVGDRMRVTSGSFHKYKWKAKTREAEFGDTIDGFSKESVSYETTLTIRGPLEERKEFLNELRDSFEYDITHATPGRIYFGQYYINAYVTSSETGVSDIRSCWSKNEIEIYCPYPFWIYEKTFQILPQSSEQSLSGLDFPCDFPFDFAPAQSGILSLEIDHYAASHFQMHIYGPCTNPSVTINGYPYQIYTTLESGDYLIINSRNHTVVKYLANGTTANLYNSRAFKQSVFEKIPCGKLTVNWTGTFGFDLKLFLERSEPKW